MDRLICRLFGHDVWLESDEAGPYQHECARCGWTHPWHGHDPAARTSAGLDRWPAALIEPSTTRAA